MPKFKMLGKK